jgi:DNA-binding transcriptional MocR family regulator
VAVASGRRFDYEGRALPFFRLGFAGLDEGELTEAVGRLAAALEPGASRSPGGKGISA